LNTLQYAADLGEHLDLLFSGASRENQRDVTVEMKPPRERLLSLEWCGDQSFTRPETSLGGLGLSNGMIGSAADHHHGS
jgi:hypothetical protein